MSRFKKKLTGNRRRLYALKFPREDNYMVKFEIISEVFILVGWKPFIDLCCNVIGSNALALFFFSGMTDALRQKRKITGMDLMVNPCFDMCL